MALERADQDGCNEVEMGGIRYELSEIYTPKGKWKKRQIYCRNYVNEYIGARGGVAVVF
jgi:hypothetical protein